MKRINSNKSYSTHIQPVFLIGTYNEDGTPNFCPITWVSSTHDRKRPLMTISMNGKKKTKENIARTNVFSANLVSVDMVELMDYFGSQTGFDGVKDALPYKYENGHVLQVPTLNASRRVYEFEVLKTFDVDETTTYFCVSKNCQQIKGLTKENENDVALLEPLVYTGSYYKAGEFIGRIGDFYMNK
jgi:flavin reductase (DIM6/NTAB) family NADH-FMN oxidoreductase RutF